MINIWKNRKFKPMLLEEISKPFNSEDYIFELKFDGIRALIFATPSSIYIQSRNGTNMTNIYPELQNISKIVNGNVIFDGEIVSFSDGKPDFGKLQRRSRLKSEVKIKKESISDPAIFVCFDIIYENDDLTNLDLMKRKEVLNKYKDTDVFIKSKVYEKDGVALFNMIKKSGLEGIVAKNKKGTYHINERTDDFIKIKNIQREEFVVCGYIDKNDSVCSLLLGEYRNKKLYYVGKVLMGKKQKLYEKLSNMKNIKNTFVNYEEKGKFIKPVIKCYIEFLERTKNDSLRHPVYKGEVNET